MHHISRKDSRWTMLSPRTQRRQSDSVWRTRSSSPRKSRKECGPKTTLSRTTLDSPWCSRLSECHALDSSLHDLRFCSLLRWKNSRPRVARPNNRSTGRKKTRQNRRGEGLSWGRLLLSPAPERRRFEIGKHSSLSFCRLVRLQLLNLSLAQYVYFFCL